VQPLDESHQSFDPCGYVDGLRGKGGYLGARLARRIPAPMLRAGIVAIGLLMTTLFFLRG